MSKTIGILMLAAFSILPYSSAWAIGDPGMGEKAVAVFECQQCHATDGKSERPGIPSLAGQKNGYLVRTLMHFKFGTIQDTRSSGVEDEVIIQRKHPVMNELTTSMSVKTITDIAAYYATRSCGPGASADQAEITPPAGVETCEICHGGMRSNPWADTPYLAGQDKTYLIEQIQRLWNSIGGYEKSASRHYRLAEIMFRDTDAPNLAAYADYYAKLPCQN